VVEDTGSGINWKRKGLKTILGQSMSGDIEEVVVAHRDRLCRFGFELIEWILESNGVKLTVLDRENSKSPDEELTDDILSIIHVYSCRKMGQRRYKVSENKTLPECESENHV
jgi:predicted site-specific integrase-resolvase